MAPYIAHRGKQQIALLIYLPPSSVYYCVKGIASFCPPFHTQQQQGAPSPGDLLPVTRDPQAWQSSSLPLKRLRLSLGRICFQSTGILYSRWLWPLFSLNSYSELAHGIMASTIFFSVCVVPLIHKY